MCVCAWVVLNCLYLLTLGVCVVNFTLSSLEFLFISQCSPRAELPKWNFYRERERGEREGRKSMVWVGRTSVRGWRHERYDKMEEDRDNEGRREGRLCQFSVVALLSVNSRKSISWGFHKTLKRDASFYIIYQTSARSTHSLIRRATHESHPHIPTHERKFLIKCNKKDPNTLNASSFKVPRCATDSFPHTTRAT